MPIILGAGTQRPQNFGATYMLAHSMRNINQILHGDKLGVRKFLQGRPRPLSCRKTWMTRMLTRDLFAVADLVISGTQHPEKS